MARRSKKSLMWIFIFFLSAGQNYTPEKASHDPSDWSLGASLALSEAMQTLGLSRFSLQHQRANSTSCSLRFEDSKNKDNILYMAATINAANAGMSGEINCQAVISKIRSLQTSFGSDADGLHNWRVSIYEQKCKQGRFAQAETARQKRRREIEEKAGKIFNKKEIVAIMAHKELVLEFIRLLEEEETTSSLLRDLMDHLVSEEEEPAHVLHMIKEMLLSQEKLQNIGEEELLPRLFSAFARVGSNLEDWPRMIQSMYDFAMVLSAKDPRGIRWSDATKDYYAWMFIQAGKQVVGNMRGFGWSNVNGDDDAGKASRRHRRLLTDQGAGADGGEDSNAGVGRN